jgi:cytochrome c
MTNLRTMILPLAAGLSLLSGVAAAQESSDAQEGKLAFNNNCRRCHVTNEGDNRLGPSLHNVLGREAGSSSGFAYSSAMKNASIVWDEETLDAYIENPDAVVPGNRMKPYPGVSSAEERANIIAHLKAESGGG